jgi:hypothetical protein
VLGYNVSGPISDGIGNEGETWEWKEQESTTYIMRGQEGLSQHIIDPGTLKAVVYTSIRHLTDHLHNQLSVYRP